ncbi:MAG: hypothetical protein N2645_03935 [Clostridia bacterium]|nr:hypothetical protein [Clostridia bacterium]
MDTLKTGKLVAIKHFAFEKFIICPIIKTEGNQCTVFIGNNQSKFSKDDLVVIMILLESNVYVCEAYVKNVTETYCEFILSKIEKTPEIRKNIRYMTSFNGSAVFNGNVAVAAIKSIDVLNCSINVGLNLSVDDYLNISFIWGASDVIVFFGKVIKKQQMNECLWSYDIEMSNINEPNFKKVLKLLGKLEAEELEVIKELKQ